MDENRSKYILEADVSQFKESIKSIQQAVDQLAHSLNGITQKDLSINVNINDRNFTSVFRRLNQMMETSDRAAADLTEHFNQLFSGKAFKEGFTKVFADLQASVEKTGKAITDTFGIDNAFGKSLTNSISEAIAKGFEKGLDEGLARKKGFRAQIESALGDTAGEAAKDKVGAMLEDIKLTQDTFNNIENGFVNAIQRGMRKLKDMFPELSGTENWSQTMLYLNQHSNELSKSGRHWSQKELAEQFGREMAKGYAEQLRFDQTQNSLTSITEFNKTINKLASSLSAYPERIDAAVERTQKIAEYKERRAEIQTRRAEAEYDAYLARQAMVGEKRAKKEASYRLNVGKVAEMARSVEGDTSVANAQRRYLQARAHINTMNQQIRDSLYTQLPTQNTMLSAQLQLQKATANFNTEQLKDTLGLDKIANKSREIQDIFNEWGTQMNKVSNIMMNLSQAIGTIHNLANKITTTILNSANRILTRVGGQVRSLISDATSAFQSLETSMIGFANFFGDAKAEMLMSSIKNIAAKAPQLDTAGLAEYVHQLAPISNGNADLALNASLGMLKTIQYGGANGSTEMEYVIKNVRDVLSKGKATAIDLRQFNRAMPILEKVLGDIGESSLLKDGKLNITKENANTLLSAFARLNTDENSPVADIYGKVNATLGGQWEQFTEQLKTDLMETLQDSGIYGRLTNLLKQFNSGEYVGTALKKLTYHLDNFMHKINWFEIQRIGKLLYNSFQTIGKGVKEMFDKVKSVSVTSLRDILNNGSTALQGFISQLGNVVTQIIKIVDRLLASPIAQLAIKFAPTITIITKFTQVMLNFTQQINKAIGSTSQFLGNYMNDRLKKMRLERQAMIDAIPSSVLSSGSNLRVGVDKNGNYVALGKDHEGFSGTGVMTTYDKQGNIIDKKEYADYRNGEKAFSAVATDFEKTFKYKFNDKFAKVMDKGIKLLNGVANGIQGIALTETVANVAESMGLFGEHATEFAGIVRSAGYAISFAIMGASIGGVAGGVVGALIGLGVGVVNLINTIKQQNDRLTNEVVEKQMTTEKKNIADILEQALIEQGVLEKNVGARDNEQNFAWQKTYQAIANMSQGDLAKVAANPMLLTKVFNDAKKYQTVREDFTNENTGKGFDFSKYRTGSVVTADNKEYLDKLSRMVGELDLLSNHGWTREWNADTNEYLYKKLDNTYASGEEIMNEFKKTQNGTDKLYTGQIDAMEKYIANETGTVGQKLDKEMKGIEDVKVTIDNRVVGWQEKIYDEIRITNEILRDKDTTHETVAAEHGEIAAKSWEKHNELATGVKATIQQIGLDKLVDKTGNRMDALINWAHNIGMDTNAFDDIPITDFGNMFDLAKNMGKLNPKSVLNKLIEQIEKEEDAYKKQHLIEAYDDMKNFRLESMTDMSWWLRLVNYWQKALNMKFYAHGGRITTPIYRAAGGRGVDTVPAMLSPGEFVMRPSAVNKAGLGVMYALNRGDVASAARSLSSSVTKTWNMNSGNTSTTDNRRSIVNNIRVVNKNARGRLNNYYALANRLSF